MTGQKNSEPGDRLADEGLEIGPPTPLGALRFRMEQGGHTQADLAKLLGSRSRAAEILSGKRSLSKAQVVLLADEWGIPARSLLGPALSSGEASISPSEASAGNPATAEPLNPHQPKGGETVEPVASFQARIEPWMRECFGDVIPFDRLERGDRLLEEVLELLQSGGYPRERVGALRDYVWGRPPGDPPQEVGGVMVTLGAYCLAFGLDMHEAGETELARIWTKVEQIRAKQAAKPTGSALPVASPAPRLDREEVARVRREIQFSAGETLASFDEEAAQNTLLGRYKEGFQQGRIQGAEEMQVALIALTEGEGR